MEELKILQQAILNEVEGQQFYGLAAQRASDAAVQEAFSHLAREERQHEVWLRKMYEQVAANQATAFDELEIIEALSPQIFRLENVGVESGSLEISVYKIGILLEMASGIFYKNAAEAATTPAVKKLLQQLSEWEEVHLKSLQKIYDVLQEEWWDKQGFSPA
ncbi:MAG: ferritin family protein [Dethiobacter sp.]|jgi:rubrerythrin|nr:ferritin family protein [Dethiobacter sp.]MBS3899831.1 ferritin family protein [Dethiobacter sp.]MBS3983569.1 ferritin family protein [Dethiobacter sp.]MCL4462595.1 ferritin family protein [Bacillota bacterium]